MYIVNQSSACAARGTVTRRPHVSHACEAATAVRSCMEMLRSGRLLANYVCKPQTVEADHPAKSPNTDLRSVA
ncbi:hypothetical protein DAI22_03g235900 [Oryza sativa Japonica Group]|nr:hypothetical protein DAI22_03g235900 [Oryza sativa Japonica Group]